MKLSRFGPKSRTVLITTIVLMLALFVSSLAFGRELRVTTAADLRACVSGGTLNSGPDKGLSANAGDTCVVLPGTYFVSSPVEITVENLILRSTDGATATIIRGDIGKGLVNVVNRGVTVGGPSSDQGFTIQNDGGVGICVTEPGDGTCTTVTTGPAADENITIQNNIIQHNKNEGILFHYSNTTSIDTIYIKDNTIKENGGDGIAFSVSTGSIGRMGFSRNVVINGNTIIHNNTSTSATPNKGGATTYANVHFYNTGSIEQLAILDNIIEFAGVQTGGTVAADGIKFDDTASAAISGIRDTLIDGNLIQYNSQNGIKFDYNNRLGENVKISNNRGTTPDQGITHNGPAGALSTTTTKEGNGIYITSAVIEVRGLSLVNNTINSNRGYGIEDSVPCRHGNGLGIEADGRVEDLLLQGNDFRLNFNDGVCIANGSDFDRSTVTDNNFVNNGTGDYINPTNPLGAPFGDGFGVYHDVTTFKATKGVRVENIAFSGNLFRENGSSSPTQSGLGFGLFIRTEQAEISRVTFDGDHFIRNYIGGVRLDTDNGNSGSVRSGDIREITIKDVLANESQANPGLTSFGGNLKDNGDGIALVTDSGDISGITVDPTTASNNGGFGLRIESDGTAENATSNPSAPGDIDNVTIKDSTFNYNGTRASIGRGSGILISGYSVRVVSIDPTTSSNNNDHGVQVTGSRTVSNITVKDSTFNGNDRNKDTIGDGIQINATQDLSQIAITGNTANANYAGIRVGSTGRQIAQNVDIENNTANDNRKEGISLFAGRDMITVKTLANTLLKNGIGISLTVVKVATDIELGGNLIAGDNGTGTGIILDASSTTTHCNAIRTNATGIEVRRADQDKINYNNIARNEKFGVDASALQPGASIDATNVWWGEPSGPKHSSNANGIGDRVTDKVNFQPFLSEPVSATSWPDECPAEWQSLVTPSYKFMIDSFTGPTSADKGVKVTYEAQIKNSGTDEGTQEITLTVTQKGSDVPVAVKSVTKTINPSATTKVTFDYEFPAGGDYTVKLATQNDSKSIDVHVKGPVTVTIEQAVAKHSGDPTLIEDPDITWAVELWVTDDIVPGTDGLKIDDTEILKLVDMWINGTPVAAASAAAVEAQSKPQGLWGWLLSFFAPRSAVAVENQASPSAVAPGGSFTVTLAVKGEVSGLLLTESLPSGWTITPVDNGGAFYKPSEHKWLWLGGPDAVSLTYKVNVPADAAPGTYTISGSYKTADGAGSIAPLSITVAGTPVALKVDAIKFSNNTFMVEGVGVAGVEAQVWNLAGLPVFSGSGNGNVLALSTAAPLANGVYLYAVTVKGADGTVLTSQVRKMVVLR